VSRPWWASRQRAVALLALLSLAACAEGQERPLLDATRIAALPAAERDAWLRYLEASRHNRQRDRAALDAEVRAAGRERWTPAPAGPGFVVEKHMTDAWFRGEDARRTADAIVSFQTPTGGWSKRVDFRRARRPGENWASEGDWSWIGTLDNGATTEQMRFLAGVIHVHGDPRHRDSFLRGLDYLILAQFPNGCWPQVYPLVGSYHDAVTYNDDAMVHALDLLRSVARGEYAFVPEEGRRHAAVAVERGIGCVLATQVVVGGHKTVWGAQHDPLTLAPVRARPYEHAALSGRESARIIDFLMGIESPEPAAVAAVHAAAAWFRQTAIYGFTYEPRGRLAARDGAGPLWARFYEIGTNRPIFSDREGVIRYDLREIGEERRRGYLWYSDEPAATLRRYDAWARRHPEGASVPR
jgi:PelA/Pel-15E family pectate lyase